MFEVLLWPSRNKYGKYLKSNVIGIRISVRAFKILEFRLVSPGRKRFAFVNDGDLINTTTWGLLKTVLH